MIAPPVPPSDGLRDRIEAVVIGASAGGVEALAVILPALPATFRPRCSLSCTCPGAPQPAGGDLRKALRVAGARS